MPEREKRILFNNEAYVLSECRKISDKENLIGMNQGKNGIPPCFETDKYYGLTLRARFSTLRELKQYLKGTDKRLNEAQ